MVYTHRQIRYNIGTFLRGQLSYAVKKSELRDITLQFRIPIPLPFIGLNSKRNVAIEPLLPELTYSIVRRVNIDISNKTS
jgi:hypothetical protein